MFWRVLFAILPKHSVTSLISVCFISKHGDTKTKELHAKMETTPHLYNLNADTQMCKIIVHILENGQEYTVGKPSDEVQIPLSGARLVAYRA